MTPNGPFIPSIKSFHVELSSYCNAKCLGCARTSDMNSKIEAPLKPQHLNPEHLYQILQSSAVPDLDDLFLCGALGDPMAHPEVVPLLKNIFAMKKDLHVSIHTNGSLGSEETWSQLGSLSQMFSLNVVFSIDGLADTNHLYRVGVPWEKVINNAKVFIAAGGRATWKFIVFPSNQHQIEDAEKMATEMGFKKFKLRQSYDSKRNPGATNLAKVELQKKSSQPFKDWTLGELADEVEKKYPISKSIQCKSQQDRQLYLDSWGRIWPCCWLGTDGVERRAILSREFFKRTFLHHQSPHFNGLDEHSLDDILQHDWYLSTLQESWNHSYQQSNPCNPTCAKQCGVMKG